MCSFVIGGFQKSSLIDYPGKISAIIFTQGCNFRCPYCHNPELIGVEVNGKREMGNSIEVKSKKQKVKSDEHTFNLLPFAFCPSLEKPNILEFLKSRINKLDAVVISGGEPCLQDGLVNFIKEIKVLGFLVKLDTNGSHPDVLKNLLDETLIDYVAMDIKSPIEKYSKIACCQVDTSNILKSIEILKTSGVDYEFRTTVVKSQLDSENFEKIGKMIKGAEKYYLQKFVPTKTLNKNFISQETYSDEEFEKIKLNLKKYVKEVCVR